MSHMSINLNKILQKAGWSPEYKNDVAVFYNKAPWRGDAAYVHIVFEPASADALSDADSALMIPDFWKEFLMLQNGASLFSGGLIVFGVKRKGALLHRSDPFRLGPLSILTENFGLPAAQLKTSLVIGTCDNSRSLAIFDRLTGTVSAVPREHGAMSAQWASPSVWIKSEAERLGREFRLPEGKRPPLP